MKKSLSVINLISALITCLLVLGCQPEAGKVQDEAKKAGRDVNSFLAADEDYFHDMDGGIELTTDEVKGRNMWLVWTAGNDRFWDTATNFTFGSFDLLKILSSYPGLNYSRDNRWQYLGLVNEPCFEKATAPDMDRFGLWLDKRRSDCPPDPFENEQKYPGVQFGPGGTKSTSRGSFYGYATGIVGLRLFPNPDFDEAAARRWDSKRYYEDPTYYLSKDLVRPYRVGMACAFCHVGPSPLKPPIDPENPKWENLNSTVGAQYFWFDRIFIWNPQPDNFAYQLLHTNRPGALDTSLVSTDSINNPRTMNAIYNVGARLAIAKRWGKEMLAGGSLKNSQFNDFYHDGPLTKYFEMPNVSLSPHILKDASDSVGTLGALNRVYLNIGVFSEEWLLHFNAFIGGKPITPIEIDSANRNSTFWNATVSQAPNMALFLLKAGNPDKLKDAPGGAVYLTKDTSILHRGKIVFADRCARCHSSKVPPSVVGLDPAGCAGPGYLDCWNRYWNWTKTEEYKKQMRQIVLAADFLDNNYLSTDVRVPVTLLETNACSPLATNAIAHNIWDNFSSQTYKDLPSVGKITVHNPFTGEPRPYNMPAGGRGYTRPPSLIALWSTAPFLLNNSLGPFDYRPSVEARMKVFQASIEQLLWPEKREKDPVLGHKVPGTIDRTTSRSYISVPTGYLPDHLQALQPLLHRLVPWLFSESEGVRIGPIPAGTPVNLIANLNVLPDDADAIARAKHAEKVLELLVVLKKDLGAIPANATDEEAKRILHDAGTQLLELSKCPDFVVNRGHYFGTDRFQEEPALSDQEKRDLIWFLKTF